MKCKSLILTLFIASFAFFSCSPAKHAEKIAKTFCEQLKGYEDFTSMSDFYALRAAADSAIMEKMNICLEHYSKDSSKLEEFNTAYYAAIAPAMNEFNSAAEDFIRGKLKDQGWYREKDPNKYYLYSLSDDSLNVMNCKDKIAYRLHFDTLFFDDADSTVARIEFVEDSLIRLVNLKDESRVGTYRKAKIQDLIVGTWTFVFNGKSAWTTFKENGTYSGQEWQDRYGDGWIYHTNVSGRYSVTPIDDSTYRLIEDGGVNGLNHKIVMKDVDKFKQGGWIRHRSKKGSPKNLDILFDKA